MLNRNINIKTTLPLILAHWFSTGLFVNPGWLYWLIPIRGLHKLHTLSHFTNTILIKTDILMINHSTQLWCVLDKIGDKNSDLVEKTINICWLQIICFSCNLLEVYLVQKYRFKLSFSDKLSKLQMFSCFDFLLLIYL